MLQVEIDGKQIEVQQGTTVMEAAHELGTYIPHFCYHKKLSIAANCRMCLVEVEKAPKPLPACATPVTDGMVVHTHSAKAKQAQEGVMEFLLINHPLDCPICDQGGECQLQDLAVGYGKSGSRYQEEKRSVVGKDMGPLVSAEEMSRCIHCTRCVRFTEEIAGEQEIGMANRGEFSEIMPFIGKAVETELSGNVIDLCPVGALTSKPFRYDARSWEMSRRKSISAHDALGSNLIVQTKDHTIRRVLPLEKEDINECWISDRDRFSYEGLYHQSRLINPKIKHGGEWKEVDWQTALEYVRHTLECIAREDGKNQIGMWANPMNTIEELYLAKKWAKGLGVESLASKLRESDTRLSGTFKGAQWLGQTIEQLAACGSILIVGANLRKEQPLLTARLRRSAKNGTAVSIIAANKETLHMPLLAQNITHPNQWVEDINHLINNQDNTITASLKNAPTSAIILGADVQNHPDYASIYAAAQKLAVETNSTLGILPQAANSVGADMIDFHHGKNGSSLPEMLAQPKKAIVLLNVEPEIDVAGGNKVINALKQAASVIAMTPYESETLLDVCDVLLPIAPFTETSGSFVNMEGRLQSFHGVVKGLGESRPLWKILRVLGNVFELDGFDYETSEQILTEAFNLNHLNNKNLKQELNNPNLLADKLDNYSTWKGNHLLASQRDVIRVGGVGIYHTDAIVRRAESLQKTNHASTPEARVHPITLSTLSLSDGDNVVATQDSAIQMNIVVRADTSLPENVVYLPIHSDNAALGSLMNVIELKRA